MRLRLATRKSPLALVQSEWVKAHLEAAHPGLAIELVPLVTEGDRVLDRPLARVGGKGLFVSEVEQALARGDADFAVHSMKDVPESLLDGMTLGAIPEREDARDVLITRDGSELMSLEAASTIGTSSLRRTVQIRRQRNDLAFGVLRGNVGTRLQRVAEGRFTATVLALAGLKRLGVASLGLGMVGELASLGAPSPIAIGRPMSLEESIPAVGQGALAIECRQDDARVIAILAALDHEETRLTVAAERAFQRRLSGSCSTPMAAHARLDGGVLRLDGLVGSLDGETVLTSSSTSVLGRTPQADASELGRQVAETLLAHGAQELLDAAKQAADPHAGFQRA